MTTIQKQLAELGPLLPEVRWMHGDDLCDCVFQRIGEWYNAFLGQTLRVRMCCIWGEIYKEYPDFVELIPACFDLNTKEFAPYAIDWNSEDADMPRALWYRQIAYREGMTLPEVRNKYWDKEPPTRVPVGTGQKTAHLPES